MWTEQLGEGEEAEEVQHQMTLPESAHEKVVLEGVQVRMRVRTLRLVCMRTNRGLPRTVFEPRASAETV